MENFETKSKKSNELKKEEIELSIESNKDEKIQSFISKLPRKEGFINFDQLQKVGHGGTHDVFIYPQNPTFVIKLNRGALEKVISIGQAKLLPEVRKIANEYTECENNKNKQLYKYFGQEHCLSEKIMVQKINFKKDGIPRNIEGVISIQEASDIFKNPNRKDFSTSYAEKDLSIKENRGSYDKMNKALLSDGKFNEKDFFEFNEKLKPIFELVDKDKEFVESIKEFLLKFKKYFEETGNFIDLVGEENVLFYKQDEKWTFQLGSVIKGENKKFMKKILNALEEDPEILNQNKEMRNQLMNQLAFIRLLNATGLKTVVGKIIDVRLTEKQLANLDKVKFK